MKVTLIQLWRDERAFITSMEMILIATITVVGVLVGMVVYRDAIVQELADTGSAIGQLNQSYSLAIAANGSDITVSGSTVTITENFGDLDGNTATTTDPRVKVVATFQNFSYSDLPDVCDTTQTTGQPPAGIQINQAAINEGQTLP